jgi:hypothetical protein
VRGGHVPAFLTAFSACSAELPPPGSRDVPPPGSRDVPARQPIPAAGLPAGFVVVFYGMISVCGVCVYFFKRYFLAVAAQRFLRRVHCCTCIRETQSVGEFGGCWLLGVGSKKVQKNSKY